MANKAKKLNDEDLNAVSGGGQAPVFNQKTTTNSEMVDCEMVDSMNITGRGEINERQNIVGQNTFAPRCKRDQNKQ